jgi:urease accessory protein UreE
MIARATLKSLMECGFQLGNAHGILLLKKMDLIV